MKDIKDYLGTDTGIHCISGTEGDYIGKMVDKVRGTCSPLQCLENIDFSKLSDNGEFVIYLDNRCFDTLNDCLDISPKTQLIRAPEFLPKETKGELTKEEAKVLTEDYEFGEKIGSIQWAFKGIKNKKDIWYLSPEDNKFKCRLLNGGLYIGNTKAEFSEKLLNGFYEEQKTPKEEFTNFIKDNAYLQDEFSSEFSDKLKVFLKNYNITKKTNQKPEHESATKIED